MSECMTELRTAIPGRGFVDLAANEYSGVLRAYLSRRLGNPQDVEDAAQDVFLRLTRMNTDGLVVNKPIGLICRIADCVLWNLIESRAQDRVRMVSPSQVQYLLDSAIAEGSQKDLSEDLSVIQRIETALSHLSDEDRALFVLVHRDGLKYEEAAARLNIKKESAKKKLQRARKLMKSSV